MISELRVMLKIWSHDRPQSSNIVSVSSAGTQLARAAKTLHRLFSDGKRYSYLLLFFIHFDSSRVSQLFSSHHTIKVVYRKIRHKKMCVVCRCWFMYTFLRKARKFCLFLRSASVGQIWLNSDADSSWQHKKFPVFIRAIFIDSKEA